MARKMRTGIFLTREDVANLSYPIYTGVMDFQDGNTVARYSEQEIAALRDLNAVIDSVLDGGQDVG